MNLSQKVQSTMSSIPQTDDSLDARIFESIIQYHVHGITSLSHAFDCMLISSSLGDDVNDHDLADIIVEYISVLLKCLVNIVDGNNSHNDIQRISRLLVELEGTDGVVKRIEAAMSELTNAVSQLNRHATNLFFENEVSQQKIAGKTAYLNTRFVASIVADNKSEIIDAMKANGFESIVKESIHAGTLASWVKEFERDTSKGTIDTDEPNIVNQFPDIPEEIAAGLKVSEITTIRVRKS